MDPVSLIEAALVAGAAASAKDTTSQAVKDAYSSLKMGVSRLLASKPKALITLDDHQTDHETYAKPLKKELAEAHVDQNNELLEAAQRIIESEQSEQLAAGNIVIHNIGTVQGLNIAQKQKINQVFGKPQ